MQSGTDRVVQNKSRRQAGRGRENGEKGEGVTQDRNSIKFQDMETREKVVSLEFLFTMTLTSGTYGGVVGIKIG